MSNGRPKVGGVIEIQQEPTPSENLHRSVAGSRQMALKRSGSVGELDWIAGSTDDAGSAVVGWGQHNPIVADRIPCNADVGCGQQGQIGVNDHPATAGGSGGNLSSRSAQSRSQVHVLVDYPGTVVARPCGDIGVGSDHRDRPNRLSDRPDGVGGGLPTDSSPLGSAEGRCQAGLGEPERLDRYGDNVHGRKGKSIGCGCGSPCGALMKRSHRTGITSDTAVVAASGTNERML